MKKEKIIDRCTCERCGHEWDARQAGTPVSCPKCRSPYWDRMRVRGRKEGREA